MPLSFAAQAAPSAGIGWRHPHYAQVLTELPALGFLEVHSENFFGQGGAALHTLTQARSHYPISLHGVGLALGSALGVDDAHLNQLAYLVQRIEPVRISDHACFARGAVSLTGAMDAQAVHAADLLPISFNTASLNVLCANVQHVQDRLQRTLLIENLSAYVNLPGSDWSETEFLNTLAQRTGCQLLVDVNNIYVNALNAQNRSLRDADAAVHVCRAWLDAIEPSHVGEIHLAGHCAMDDIVIDDHGAHVSDGVWSVYQHAVRLWGAQPALIEWDTDIPPLPTLLAQAQQADCIACAHAATATAEHSA